MKKLIGWLSVSLFIPFQLLCGLANATDWSANQCPVVSPISGTTDGSTAGPGNCSMGSGQVVLDANGNFNDTLTFGIGNWPESYGVWTFTSTTQLDVAGRAGVTPCSGRGGCRGNPYEVIVDSASIDGVALNPPSSGYPWTLPEGLAVGPHTLIVNPDQSATIDGNTLTLTPSGNPWKLPSGLGGTYTLNVSAVGIPSVNNMVLKRNYVWTLGVDFMAGPHVVAAIGHTTGALWQGSRWGVVVEGLLYTLEPGPAPTCPPGGCDD